MQIQLHKQTKPAMNMFIVLCFFFRENHEFYLHHIHTRDFTETPNGSPFSPLFRKHQIQMNLNLPKIYNPAANVSNAFTNQLSKSKIQNTSKSFNLDAIRPHL